MAGRTKMVRRSRARRAKTVRPFKIVVTGPFAAGKTTLIKTISEVAIVGTERNVSDETQSTKPKTTVAMDFGRITFADDLSLFLFGTPGQRRFEVMWEILSEGMIGFILLVNAGDWRSVEEASHILDQFRRYAEVPYVIGITHLDDAGETLEVVSGKVRETLELPERIAVLECDPRQREDVKTLMLHILVGVLRRLEEAAAKKDPA
jgi:signal recognition particle receptor subunit beta